MKQQTVATKGGIPGGNPMNLTCKPVTGAPTSNAAEAPRDGDAASKYAVIMNASNPASPPNNSWTTTVFVSEVDYIVEQDGAPLLTIPAGCLGIYSK
ncbi:MAG TPA: hypothetical protein VFL13_03450 [Candidatus Baltobacteraceae bacterium]|nr:hypothetical protein [Candidatus Baltobacteraceae bacterium]